MDFDDWRQLPAQPSVFIYLVAEGSGHTRSLATDLRRRLLPIVSAWVDQGGDQLVAAVDGEDYEPTSTSSVETTTSRWVSGEVDQLSLAAGRERERTGRFAHFRFGSMLSAQVLVAAAEPEAVSVLLELLRTLAPFSIYAYGRLATPTSPTEADTTFSLKRPVTSPEQLAVWDQAYERVGEQVLGLYPVQLLTDRHVDLINNFDELDVEELHGGTKFIVCANEMAWQLGSADPVGHAVRQGWDIALVRQH